MAGSGDEDSEWPAWLPRDLPARGPIATWDPKTRGAFLDKIHTALRSFAWQFLNARSPRARAAALRLMPRIAKQQHKNEDAADERYLRRERRRDDWPTGDVVEIPVELRDQLSWSGDPKQASWFLELRRRYGDELAGRRAIFRKPLHTLRRDGRAEEREALAGLNRLRALDRRLYRELKAASEAILDEDRYATAPPPPPAEESLRRAIQKLAAWLRTDPNPPPGWGAMDWNGDFPPRTRGPDRAPRRRRPSRPRTPAKTRAEKKEARIQGRVERIVALLRKHPDGLSKNRLRSSLKMGRGEATAALEQARAAGAVERRGSLEDPRYCASEGVIRKPESKRSP